MALYLLTSSRADFGIYQPLIKEILKESLELRLIVFGTHLSKKHGYTITDIERIGSPVYKSISTLPSDDSALAVSASVGETIKSFSNFWNEEQHEVDCIICLGDRYEMYAAVAASIPFNLKVAHLHGGETTLGAIDNKYRHSLTVFSDFHFCATDVFADRIKSIIGSGENVFNVGALSIENIEKEDVFTVSELEKEFEIDFSKPTILTTFHPETVSPKQNKKHIEVLREVIPVLLQKQQLVITLPNADTSSEAYRTLFWNLAEKYENLKLVEHFGRKGYFSALKYCSFVFGNSSSGIIEAASFNKYVINVGVRQEGRLTGKNVFDCEFDSDQILKLVENIEKMSAFSGGNIYQKEGTAKVIVNELKNKLDVE